MKPTFTVVTADLGYFAIFMSVFEFTVIASAEDEMRVIVMFGTDDQFSAIDLRIEIPAFEFSAEMT